MSDEELLQWLYARYFPNEQCEKCGCHRSHHGWHVVYAEVRCHNCWTEINMAQNNFVGNKWTVCYRDIFEKDALLDTNDHNA